ncbi:hypothetical protein BDK51DRAFT_40131 [Blyttiomyces helicus]|uniref:MARVEL domain-containing protein n=1 Tax=Blyttiomyces helicus TaxID=388810 RepID=A0A4P9W949_9FUNG|nr:hypothetical protein BDK51DRAFT_40131 [Blyttiomyces helicus]|eukprot:RKO89071.1 hypothetical protein BDK51DRAFT_40131 [Blyttiomyces helicus]
MQTTQQPPYMPRPEPAYGGAAPLQRPPPPQQPAPANNITITCNLHPFVLGVLFYLSIIVRAGMDAAGSASPNRFSLAELPQVPWGPPKAKIIGMLADAGSDFMSLWIRGSPIPRPATPLLRKFSLPTARHLPPPPFSDILAIFSSSVIGRLGSIGLISVVALAGFICFAANSSLVIAPNIRIGLTITAAINSVFSFCAFVIVVAGISSTCGAIPDGGLSCSEAFSNANLNLDTTRAAAAFAFFAWLQWAYVAFAEYRKSCETATSPLLIRAPRPPRVALLYNLWVSAVKRPSSGARARERRPGPEASASLYLSADTHVLFARPTCLHPIMRGRMTPRSFFAVSVGMDAKEAGL